MKTLMRRTAATLAGLLVLLVLFHLIENWRGRRVWAAWQQTQAASGDRFDIASFVPSPVPDSENFALVPRIADAINGKRDLLTLPGGWPNGTGTWPEAVPVDLSAYAKVFPKGDVRKGLEAYRSSLDDFVTATRKPGCRLPIDYVRFPDIEIPALLGWRAEARMLQLRALVELRDGHSDAAFEDVSALLRTVQHFQKEPILLCQLLRLALTNIAMQPIWEGIETHAWTEGQLTLLQKELGRIDLLASFANAWRFEQALSDADHAQVVQEMPWEWTHYTYTSYASDTAKSSRLGSLWRHLLIPRGWVLQDAVRGSMAIQKTVRDPLDPAHHQVHPRRQDEALNAITGGGRSPYSHAAASLALVLAAQNIRAAHAQASLDEAVIACELARFRLAKGAYPERLSDLGGDLPHDVIGGAPLRYRRTEDGGYVLYSLGWNGVDDGGRTGQGEDALKKGDWVWRIPGGSNKRAG